MDSLRPRRATPLHPHRDHAPRRLRTAGGAAAGHHQGNRRPKMRARRRTHHQCAGRIFLEGNRPRDAAPRRNNTHGDAERPHQHRVPHPFARHHRPAQQYPDGHCRRSHHVAPLPRVPAMERGNTAAYQRLADSPRPRHRLRLRHRQTPGPRPFLHLPARGGLRRTSGGRKRQGQRHCG